MNTITDGSLFDGRYKIVSMLGAGGMGTVYLATQLDVNRPVALKIMKPLLIDSEEEEIRFMREIKALSQLSHKHIVSIYSAAFSSEGLPYSVSEYVRGNTLRRAMQEGDKLEWTRLRSIALQICDAMNYAHELGMVHRDLKPENILLASLPENDWVKIVDFGLVKFLGDDAAQKLTLTGHLIGSVNYMSPEQTDGKSADGRADIYALGCIIFECLSGEKLYQADNPIGVIFQQKSGNTAARISEKFSGTSPALQNLLQKMLAKNPSSRYQTMACVAKELTLIDSISLSKMSKVENFLRPAGIAICALAFTYFIAISLPSSTNQRSTKPPPEKNLSKASNIPRRADAMLHFCGSLCARGEVSNAIEAGRRWLQQNPNSVANPPLKRVYLMQLIANEMQKQGNDSTKIILEGLSMVTMSKDRSIEAQKLKRNLLLMLALEKLKTNKLNDAASFCNEAIICTKEGWKDWRIASDNDRGLALLCASNGYSLAETDLKQMDLQDVEIHPEQYDSSRIQAAAKVEDIACDIALIKMDQPEAIRRAQRVIAFYKIKAERNEGSRGLESNISEESYAVWKLCHMLPDADALHVALVFLNSVKLAQEKERSISDFTWTNLQEIFIRLKARGDALYCAEQLRKKRALSIQRNPNNDMNWLWAAHLDSLHNVARTLIEQGNANEAIAVINTADLKKEGIDLTFAEPELCALLADLAAECFEKGSAPVANKLLAQAEGMITRSKYWNKQEIPFPYGRLARAYFQAGRKETAKELFAKAFELCVPANIFTRGNAEIHTYPIVEVCNDLVKCGEYKQARKNLDLKLLPYCDSNSAQYLHCLGAILITEASLLKDRRDFKESAIVFNEALSVWRRKSSDNHTPKERIYCAMELIALKSKTKNGQ